MDSGNSGSLQSSSGGDDDFDSSRCGADSSPLSALLCQPQAPGFGAGGSLIYGLQELRTPPLRQSLSSQWCSTPASTAPLPDAGGGGLSPPPSSLLCHDDGLLAASAADQDQQPPTAPAPAPPRGSRKRARASRRAPTTVLTTDTSNFRAMVQEFTGIPAPPFASAPARSSRCFDHHHLFPSATLPQYLLRPFAQKLQAASSGPYPPPANAATATASISTAASAGTTSVPPSDGYQLTAASPSALLGRQDHHHHGSGGSSYLSFQQGTHGAQLDGGGGDAKYAAHPVFDDRGIAPPPPSSSVPRRLQDPPASFLDSLPYGGFVGGSQQAGTTTHAHHLHPRNGRGGDELSGLVGGSSVTVTGGCKATYSSTPPMPDRIALSTTSATAPTPVETTTAQQGVDSWVCTSD